MRIKARLMVRPFKWIAAKVFEAFWQRPRGANRNCDGRIEAEFVPASSVPSFFWHRAKRDGLLVKMNNASVVPV
ncbi:hypothetical protein B5V02_27110 [Mesorhizobium kowhaii]|uniref:Uncharacterized protein n=1 Tax=Mesorhizobium kowhaii TaxID=1300272 RepID=A0A2W7C1L2_9HYPH|nr:hypothetical protein B5V02_27110 [Mesorhizobium kowhaii]